MVRCCSPSGSSRKRRTKFKNEDLNPTGVNLRHLFDLSIGADNLLRTDRYRTTLRVTVVNLSNQVALYTFYQRSVERTFSSHALTKLQSGSLIERFTLLTRREAQPPREVVVGDLLGRSNHMRQMAHPEGENGWPGRVSGEADAHKTMSGLESVNGPPNAVAEAESREN